MRYIIPPRWAYHPPITIPIDGSVYLRSKRVCLLAATIMYTPSELLTMPQHASREFALAVAQFTSRQLTATHSSHFPPASGVAVLKILALILAPYLSVCNGMAEALGSAMTELNSSALYAAQILCLVIGSGVLKSRLCWSASRS